MTIAKYQNLDNALSKLRQSPLLSLIFNEFKNSVKTINDELYRTIKKEIREYLTIGLIKQNDLIRHLENHTQCLLNMISSDSSIRLDVIEEINHLKTIELFSLETNLHIYQVCQKVYSRHLRTSVFNTTVNRKMLADTISVLDELTLEYTNAVSTLAAKSYVEQSRILTQAADDKRAQQLTLLLNGYDQTDSRITTILDESGYREDGQLFCVAVASAVDPKQMLSHERARRMADSIDKLFSAEHGKRLIDVRDNKVIMIFSNLKRLSGWSKPSEGFAKRIAMQLALVGNAAYIGVSHDVNNTTHIPGAYKHALMALKLAKPSKRVICTTDLSTYEILLQNADEAIQNSLPIWADNFYRADDKSSGSLSMSLRAYAKTNMNILKAGAVLDVHPNTIYSRFNKIHHLTGLDARRFKALTELLLICDIRHSNSDPKVTALN